MKKALFKNGDTVKYLGDSLHHCPKDGNSIPVLFNGMTAVITETKLPRKGRGFMGNDSEGDPMIDEDDDGYNVFINAAGEGRIIWPYDKNKWEKVK